MLTLLGLLVPVSPAVSAPACTGSPVEIDGSQYCVFTFTASGSWTVPDGVFEIEYLVVAGGGGGGTAHGGGGGAGGVRTNVGSAAYGVTPGSTYQVIVGDGGSGGASGGYSDGAQGNDSSFADVVATGGGGGGTYKNPTGTTGRAGGSGGGGGAGESTPGGGGLGTAGQGFAGAGGTAIVRDVRPLGSGGGGGGGGAGGAGQPAAGLDGGNGGPGIFTRIRSAAGEYLAGGGGGGAYGTYGGVAGSSTTGAGGGNGGSATNTAGSSGKANTGGGGGGGNDFTPGGGSGGSGVVILRYRMVGDPSVAWYTIRFVAAGGTCTVATRTGPDTSWMKLPDSTTCQRTGHDFIGWNTAADGSGLGFAPGGWTHITGDNELYAIWRAQSPEPTSTPSASTQPLPPAPAPIATCPAPQWLLHDYRSTTLTRRTKALLDNIARTASASTRIVFDGVMRAEGATRADRVRARARAQAAADYLRAVGFAGLIDVRTQATTSDPTHRARRVELRAIC